jgi:hypothetical protein
VEVYAVSPRVTTPTANGSPAIFSAVARRPITLLTALFKEGISEMKRWIAVLVITASAFAAVPAIASAADVYEGYSRVGSVSANYSGRYTIRQGYYQAGYTTPSYGGRWDVYEGYSKIGYVTRSYGGRWDIYEGYSRVGYIQPSYGGRWNVYQGYSRVGYVNGGTGGPAAAAGLLLLVG